MDIASRRNNACAFGQMRYYPADGAVFCRGRHGDNGFTSPASCSAAHKINLAADTAVKTIAERIGTDLAG